MSPVTDGQDSRRLGRLDDPTDRALFESCADPLWILVDRRFVRANAAAAHILGYRSPADLESLHPAELSPERQPCGTPSDELADQRMREARARGGLRFEWTHRRRDGALLPIEVTLTSITFDGRAGFLCVWRDLSPAHEERRRIAEREANLRALLETTDDVVLVVDDHDRLVFANGRVADRLGFAVGAVVGQDVGTLVPPCDRERLRAALSHARESATSAEATLLPLCGADGREHVAEWRTHRGAWDEAPGTVCFVRDVAALDAASQRFERVFRTSPVAMSVKSVPENVFLDVNDAMVRMVGYTRDEIVGRTADDLGIFPDPRPFHEVSRQLRATGRFQDVDVEFRTKSGEIRCGMFSGSVVQFERETRSVSAMIDVTAQRRALDAVREAEALLRTTLCSIEDRIHLIDAAGRFVALPPTRGSLSDAARERAAFGRHYQDVLPDRIADPLRDAIDAVRRDGRAHSFECHVFEHGREHWWMILVSPWRGLDDVFRGVCLVTRDITENHRASHALEVANARLAQEIERAQSASRAKGEFLAKMSHELRTPLNGVIGMNELLGHTALDDEQRAFSEAARSSGLALRALIDDILDFSKIEAGKLSLEAVALEPAQLVDDIVTVMGLSAVQKGLRVVAAVGDDVPPHIVGDSTRLRQILTNLIGNAIKFTEQGEIVVSLEARTDDDGAPWLDFAVRDHGIGIAPEAQQRLFEEFEQEDVSTTRKHGGTGLGLAICKQLVGLMGGAIGVESAPGDGARFWFTIPSKMAPAAEEPCPGEDHPDESAPLRFEHPVLVAEDDPVNRQVAMGMLRKLGIEAEVVENGQQALDRLRTRDYALVLMDGRMPVLDGYEATRRLRSGSVPVRDPEVPVVAMSADAMASDRDACFAAGMDDHLAKPISLSSLERTLRRVRRNGRVR